MTEKENIFSKINNKYGLLGQEFVKDFCKSHDIHYREGSREEDLVDGIDCYIGKDNFATDIKNTKDIYICQIFTETNIINTRHPFKTNSKATHYCVVSVNDTEKKFIELVTVEQRLVRDYFISKDYLTECKLFLQTLDRSGIYSEGLLTSGKPLHLEQACIQLKNKLKVFLKPNVYVKYPTITDNTKEISFRLTLGDVESVAEKKQVAKEKELIAKEEVAFAVEVPGENVIIIKV